MKETAMSSLQKSIMRTTLALLCGAALVAGTAQAGAEVNFKGKTIDVILGSAAGGGTDGTSRLVGTYLEKYLPGNPTMRYRNIPGGHGAKGLNHFAKLKPDGLSWAGGSSSHTDPNALRKSVVEYDPTKFHFFGGVSRGGSIVFIRKEKLANLTDKSKPPVVVGVLDGNRSWEQMITFGKELLGWNVRFVVGYPGTSFMLLAVRRGETHMMGTSNLSLLKEMFATGDFVGVAQLGGGEGGQNDEARTNFENIPTFPTMVKGKASGLAAEAFEFWTALNDIDKWYALPPGTPKEIVDAYRTAWAKMIKDPEFIKQGKSLFSVDFAPVSGELQQEMVAKTAYPKSAIVSYMDELKVKHGLPAEPLTDEELAALAKAKGLDKAEIPSVKAKLTAVSSGGREIEFPAKGTTQKLEVSSSRTKITVAGQKAAREDLKPGMDCNIEYMDDSKEANGVACN
jgi:tripartite-type tricarboxylate transporter receptor subunit TctC